MKYRFWGMLAKIKRSAGFYIIPAILLVSAGSSNAMAFQSKVSENTLMAIAFMLSVLILKITAFILGYLIVKLGHDTMIKGVTGEVDFGFEGSGFKTKLKSGSPGAFFVLAGAAIIIWALFVEKPFEAGNVKTSMAQEQIKEIPDSANSGQEKELQMKWK